MSTYFTSAADDWHQIHTYGIHTLAFCPTSLFFPYSSWVRLVRKCLNVETFGDCLSTLLTCRLIPFLKQINTGKVFKPKFKLHIAIDSIVHLSPTTEILHCSHFFLSCSCLVLCRSLTMLCFSLLI